MKNKNFKTISDLQTFVKTIVDSIPVINYDRNNPEHVEKEKSIRWKRNHEEILIQGIYRTKGCSDICLVVKEKLNELGIDCKLLKTVRYNGNFGTHTLLYFSFENEFYIYDIDPQTYSSLGYELSPIKMNLNPGDYIRYREMGHKGVPWENNYIWYGILKTVFMIWDL